MDMGEFVPVLYQDPLTPAGPISKYKETLLIGSNDVKNKTQRKL
jgi:hypothetical protein